MSARKVRERLLRRARNAGLDLPPALVAGLEAYYLELSRWNAKVNLTAFSLEGDGSDEAVDRLLIEPVLAVRHIPPTATSILDAGSGGGSPAIPMKLARPDLALHMVEVKVRKSVFLRQLSRSLDLRNTDVLNMRFEALLTRSDLHEAMSIVSIRAVRVDTNLMTTLQAFLRPGGDLLSFVSASTRQIPPVPPMVEVGEYDLLAENRSRLIVLRKASIGLRST